MFTVNWLKMYKKHMYDHTRHTDVMSQLTFPNIYLFTKYLIMVKGLNLHKSITRNFLRFHPDESDEP